MDTPTGLAKLREPFPPNQISYLPKGGTKLAYVGHAALTDRLLDADPSWTWEPLAMADGLPVMDGMGGMWIKLTVCGVTRLGYGHAGAKKGGDAIKEVIGDALRNAGMRFGAALELWHKGELHAAEEAAKDEQPREVAAANSEKEQSLPQFRRAELDELVLYLIDCHNNGKETDAVRVYYSTDTWSAEPDASTEEHVYVWGELKGESKLRSMLKRHHPERQAA